MDVEKLKAILAALQSTDVTRLTWTLDGEVLDLRLGHPPAAAPAVMQAMPMAQPVSASQAAPSQTSAAAPAPAAAKPDSGKKTFTVNSPFVGTFYRSASPDSPSFVDLGQSVKKGQVLCIVEAMKLMNEIEADQSGKLVEALIQNGSPVEYGEALFRFEPE
ncbi:MAG TPA: acetyl-CoA carboxylase biotin carboxyl carrier protein [Myxococcales bacterium]|jgi:acetyl-CoA carboxylase biotin carboxyl carrier protein|nr:acetyl-CoA carboxylase biotin carboxyl carrier protein [Myxococcales bacterium]